MDISLLYVRVILWWGIILTKLTKLTKLTRGLWCGVVLTKLNSVVRLFSMLHEPDVALQT